MGGGAAAGGPTRRHLLKVGAFAGTLVLPMPALARIAPGPSEKTVKLYSQQTSESANATFWADGSYRPEAFNEIDRILRDPENRVQYHYVLIDFLCRPVGGELHAASDAAEVRWFTREELAHLNLAEDTLEVIQKGFAKLGRLFSIF